ncbi:hypothetical protein ACQPXH_00615 [Nocardia sp. CA-135953]|uniref:hypothetical protein n=1 Tax=Nocardia sp. CA-135953 TaxID=3239978 RepID=UPI003D96FDF3
MFSRADRFGRSIMCGNRIQYGVDGSDQCAYLGGIGIRPEHASSFAYRAPNLYSVEQS